MNEKKSLKIILATLIGALLGAVIVYITKNKFPYEVILGGLVGGIILIIAQQIKMKNKKNSVPETDERVVNNLSKFFAYMSHIALGIMFIGLSIFSFLENKFIPISYIWFTFFLYFLVTVIGGFIIKKK